MSFRIACNAAFALSLLASAAPVLAAEAMQPWTQRDLQQAITAEAQSYLQYQAFAAQARKEGQPRIAALFETVARSELTTHFAGHAHLAGMTGTPEQMLAKATNGAPYTGAVGSTADNLRTAVREEEASVVTLYTELARRNVGGGHPTITNHYLRVSAEERQHRDAFQAAIRQTESGVID
jgi:rubrerythrin